MGYRSEVAFVVPDGAPRFEEVDNVFDEIKEQNGYRLYHGDWLKWYEDYPIVQAVDAYFSKMMDEDRDDYLFIRIGESSDDVDEDGCFWDNPFGLSWTRKITFE